jgi:predicted transcriptional regulator
MLGRSSADQTEYFPAGTTLGEKNKTKQNKKKKQNSETLNPACKKLLHATLH